MGWQGLVALVGVIIVGVVMAATGASADTYMGLVLIGVGIFLGLACLKYRENPTYTDAAGQLKTIGPAMLIMMVVLGIALVVAGLTIMVVGLK